MRDRNKATIPANIKILTELIEHAPVCKNPKLYLETGAIPNESQVRSKVTSAVLFISTETSITLFKLEFLKQILLNLDRSIIANKGWTKFSNKLTNSVDPDETSQHLDRHCLQTYLPWFTELKGLRLRWLNYAYWKQFAFLVIFPVQFPVVNRTILRGMYFAYYMYKCTWYLNIFLTSSQISKWQVLRVQD